MMRDRTKRSKRAILVDRNRGRERAIVGERNKISERAKEPVRMQTDTRPGKASPLP